MTHPSTHLSILNAMVWSGTQESPIKRDIFIQDGVFVDEPSTNSVNVDGTGLTLIPGLIEAHAHLCYNAGADWRTVYDNDTPSRMLLRMVENGQKMLRSGITTVRDLGAPTELAVTLRDAIETGVTRGPSLIVAGAPVTPTGGHCYFMGGEADGELGVRVAVRERVKARTDWIKVMASGGNMTPGTNVERAQYSINEMRAIVDEAHRLGTSVTAHAHGVEGIRHALAGGVDMLEHCSFQTPNGSEPVQDVISDIVSSKTIVSPTIVGALSQQKGTERYTRRAGLTKQLVESGARILMSTDCGIPNTPHEDLSYALEVMQDMSELSALDTLRLATSTSAELLDLNDRGRIETGYRGDLLALGADPTKDLSALRDIKYVISAGNLVAR